MRAPKRLAMVVLAIGLYSLAGPLLAGEPPVPPIKVGTRDPDALYTKWRWIGIMRASRHICPKPTSDDWTTQPLFAVAPPDGDGAPWWSVSTIPAPYQFCAYETTQRSPERPTFPEGSGLIRLDRDFMGLSPAGAIDKAYASALISHFASQAGKVDLPVVASRPPVRLAIVDTAATRDLDPEDYRGTSDHGFTLLNLAKGLLCDAQGNCVAKVTSRLALGWKCFDGEGLDSDCRDAVNGGLYGLPSEMARAIHLEVQEWQADDPDKRLVMNLSIGWDPIFGGTGPLASMPIPALAVYTAIQHAVCKGAVVVAAAGNRTGGPTEEVGPILPAGWERRAAPSFLYCQALGVTPDQKDFPAAGTTPYRPLIYAAGGVRADNGPLFNSRSGGEPRLVAFGDHAKGTTTGAPGGGFTPTLTGTSIASMVLSASAAAAWYYQGVLKPPYDVLNTVYAGGTPLGRPADFCQGTAPCSMDVMRVSVCGTAAFVGGVTSCPSPTPLKAVPLAVTQFEHAVSLAGAKQPLAQTTTCHQEQLWYERVPPIDPCPHWQYYPPAPRPSTETQPGPSTICPTCPYEPESALLSIEIADDFPEPVEGGVLKCGQETYDLHLPLMQGGDTALVSNVTCPITSDPIQLSFTVGGNASVTSPVLVIPPGTP